MRRILPVSLLILAACGAPGVSSLDGGDPDAGVGKGPLGVDTTTRACLFIGGIDRIVVEHVDWNAGTCAMLRVPFFGGEPHTIPLTEPGRLEDARLFLDTTSCVRFAPGENVELTLSGGGVLRWTQPDGGFMPESVTVDAQFADPNGVVRLAPDAPIPVAGPCN